MDKMKVAYMLLGRFIHDRATREAVTNGFWVMRTWGFATTQADLWCAGVRDERIHPFTHAIMKDVEIIERTG